MADNTAQTGTATIAADDVTTLNGGASSGVLVQRVKASYGDDGTSRDVSTSFPLPVATAGDTTTGTITNTAVASVTTSAAQVLAASSTRRMVVLENLGSDYIYLGATGVTASSYFKRLTAGEVVAFTSPFLPSNAIFAIAAAGTQSLAIGVLT